MATASHSTSVYAQLSLVLTVPPSGNDQAEVT